MAARSSVPATAKATGAGAATAPAKGAAATAALPELKETIDDHFRALKTFVTREDFPNIVLTANKILATVPRDPEALHCKVIALMQESDFKAAVATMDNAGEALATTLFAFERPYALYRTKQHTRALTYLRAIPDASKAAHHWHLEAQVNYRFGNFTRAIEIYERYFTAHRLNMEVATNLLAAYVSAGAAEKALAFIRQLQKASAEDEELSFEAIYNIACVHIESGNFDEAAEQLETAEKVAREGLAEEGVPEEEIKDEISSILVQKAFVLQTQGQLDRASALYAAVMAAKPTDSAVAATASNNIITLRKQDEKVFDSLKRSEKAFQVDDEKLSARQKRAIQLNRCLLLMYGKKGEKSHELVESLQKEYPNSEIPVLVLASLYFREKRFDQSQEVLNAYIKAHPDRPKSLLMCHLTLAHIFLVRGDLPNVVATFRAAGLLHQLGVVATVVAIYERAKNYAAAAEAFEATITHLATVKDSGHSKRVSHRLLEKLAEFHQRTRNDRGALAAFTRLTTSCPFDEQCKRKHFADLVVATSRVDPAQAREVAKRLPPLALDAAITVEALQRLPPPRSEVRKEKKGPKKGEGKEEKKGEEKAARVAPAEAAAAAAAAAAGGAGAAGKKKRKRKVRLPKVLAGAPDPERWLPKWERASFLKMRKRRGKPAAPKTSSQGAAPTPRAAVAPVTGVFITAPKAAAPSKTAPVSPTPAATPAAGTEPPAVKKKNTEQRGSKRKGKK